MGIQALSFQEWGASRRPRAKGTTPGGLPSYQEGGQFVKGPRSLTRKTLPQGPAGDRASHPVGDLRPWRARPWRPVEAEGAKLGMQPKGPWARGCLRLLPSLSTSGAERRAEPKRNPSEV